MADTISFEEKVNEKNTQKEKEIQEGLKEVASMQWQYYEALLEEGFSKVEALMIISGYHPLKK